MPYVPSEKTPPTKEIIVYDDRIRIDKVVKDLARRTEKDIKVNSDLPEIYYDTWKTIGLTLLTFEKGLSTTYLGRDILEYKVASTIYDVAKKYNYDGAFLGELNYAVTIFIQEVPRLLVVAGKSSSELRYWMYAKTVKALTRLVNYFNNDEDDDRVGIAGVFEDIKDEYKVRVNQAYEIAQIIKSGDCYTTPYYNKPMEVVDGNGALIGHVYVNMKRDKKTIKEDVLSIGKLVVKKFLKGDKQ